MVKPPDDKVDIEDYDDVGAYIGDALEEGWTLEAEDFEGRPCAFCGETIAFAELMRDPDADPVTWDIRVQEPGDDEPDPYVARYYYCSHECKRADKRAVMDGGEMHEYGEPDMIHIDDVDGVV